MDTGTHFVIGVGLAGLAQLDPAVSASTTTSIAVLIGTVLGSQAPDFDGLLRLKGNAVYIKNHRGLSHSLPAILLWTVLISGGLALFFTGLPIVNITLWVFAAVCFHVFTDLFNSYGTQAMRPFSEKWIAWNIIHIFDPFIFFSHLAAIFAWVMKLAPPTVLFPGLYALIALYYVWRSVVHYRLEKSLPEHDPYRLPNDHYYALPTVHLNQWNIVKSHGDGAYTLGEWKNNQLQWLDSVKCMSHPAITASKSHPSVASFLYFSSFACAEVKEYEWGYEVRWADVRYRHRKQYPFVAVLRLNKNLKPIDSYVGWVSDSRLEKKLRIDSLS
ncbi:metal-dependent hydrolase [Paenibacillus senegalensis]|uniref:metal-dependent hydrolase n=1 Tax=Paenibacillus senegalensis TaxID=1465766 RepID=UPI0002885556|nr:metal-dependent hydrolase [Paenibacillus senegalensis]